jgi:uncharacterized repeat protein (TIGR02543 family)
MALPTFAFANVDHAVTFYENDSGSDPVVTSQTSLVSASLTQFASLSPSFSDLGFTFAGWNTSAGGGGTSYTDGATYSFASDISLYAQWTAPFRAVTFAENDSPTDSVAAEQTGNTSMSLTAFAGLTPSFSNPNHTFTGWNTSAGGGGTSYTDGATYSFVIYVILYAQWTVSAGLLTFSPNGGSGMTSPISGSAGSSITLPGAGSLTYANNTFNSWNTSANGGGTSYSAGASFVLNSAPTLYAQWTANGATPPPSTSTIVITLNGGSGAGSLSPISLSSGSSVLLPSIEGITRPGYTFSGWYSAPSGGTFLGLAGASFVPTSSVVIYAQWTANPTVTLRFSSNHGAGSIAAVTGLEGITVTLPIASKFTYPGYSFAGWNTSTDASGTSFSNGAKFTLSSTMTLYAQWSANKLGKGQSLLIGAIGPFANGSTALNGALKIQIRRIALAMKSKRYDSASLYGYATGSGSPTLNMTISAKRAISVAFYLREQLAAIHAKSVTMRSAGEGAIKGSTIAMFRRVEIFVK